jgi:DNA mismatch repair protein MutS2
MRMRNIFIDNLPTLDLHGEDGDSAVVLVKDFISDSIILNNKKIVIVHGKGTGILRKRVRDYLSKDKRVKKYYQDNFNDGVTIVEL